MGFRGDLNMEIKRNYHGVEFILCNEKGGVIAFYVIDKYNKRTYRDAFRKSTLKKLLESD